MSTTAAKHATAYDRGSESNGEAQHLDPHSLRRDEMPQLVHEDQYADDDQQGENAHAHATVWA